MFDFLRNAFIVLVASSSFWPILAMDDSLAGVIKYGTRPQIQRYFEAYKENMGHAERCAGLREAILKADVDSVWFIVDDGTIDIQIQSIDQAGGKPLKALELVAQCAGEKGLSEEKKQAYMEITQYLLSKVEDQIIPADYDEIVCLKKDHSCRNKSGLLFAGFLFCWYVYSLIMHSNSRIVSV